MEKKANNKRGGREKGVIANLQINNKTSEKKETYGGADKENQINMIHLLCPRNGIHLKRKMVSELSN